jgi:hypothetical protein
MNLRNLLILNTLIPLIYGISYQLAPEAVLSLYGVTQGSGATLLARLFGAALIGIGLLSFFSRNVKDTEAQRAIIRSMLVYDVIGIIICVHGTVTGVMSAVGWTGVAVFLILGLGFAYFQFIKPPPA